jgi:uncharacterized membrane protein YdjX (TVP38/TMEM64 family)
MPEDDCLEQEAVEGTNRKLLFFIATPLIVIGVFYGFDLHATLSAADPAWHRWVHVHPVSAVLWMLLATALSSVIGVPRLYLAMLGGALFHPLVGAALSVIGAALGSLVPYEAGRRYGRDWLDRRLGRLAAGWHQRLGRGGAALVLVLRLFPGSNAYLVSLAAGAAGVGFRAFFLATLFGIVPSTVAFVLLGDGLARDHVLELGASMASLVLLSFASVVAWRRLGVSPPGAAA